MNILTAIAVILGLIVGLGAAAAWFRQSEGKNTISLLKTNIESYKTSESQHLQRISELESVISTLESTVISKDKTISELRATLKTIVKEFKEYRNGN